MNYFLHYVISALVDHPQEINIEQVTNEDGITFYVELHAEDIGKVIGKGGKTINAIRSVINASPTNHSRVQVEVMEA